MKNVLRLFILAAAVASFTLPAFAQDTTTGAAATSTQDAQAKADLYAKFLDLKKKGPAEQKQASEVGKEYLSKYGNATEDSEKKIVDYIRNWVTKYDAAVVEFNCSDAVNKNPAQAFQLCQPLLAQNPDNLKVYLQLVGAGINNSKNGKSLNADAANAARKALQLIEQGKTSDNWAPFASQQDAPAGLRYYIGAFTFDTAPEDAATQLLQVAQSNSIFSKEPATFQLLGLSYYNGEFKKLAAEYKEKYEGKDETPESKALFDRINLVLDRVIDAYARAVALSNGKAQYASINSAVKPALTTLYKQRHENSEAGLQELIAGVLAKPLPIPGQEPVTPVAPTSSSGMTGAGGNGATPVGQAVANPVTPPAATGTAPKPAATTAAPASTKPKPRS